MKTEWYTDQSDGVVIIHCLIHIGKASLRIDRGIEVDRLDDKELVSMLINSIDDQRAGMMAMENNHA